MSLRVATIVLLSLFCSIINNTVITNGVLIEQLNLPDILIIIDSIPSDSLPHRFLEGHTSEDSSTIRFPNYLKNPNNIAILSFSAFTRNKTHIWMRDNLILHFILTKSENLYHLLQVELIKEEYKADWMRMYRWIITYKAENDGHNLFNISHFERRMPSLFQNLNFHQDNMLFFNLKINSTQEEFCYQGFKLDTLKPFSSFTQVRIPNGDPCLTSINRWLLRSGFGHPLKGVTLEVVGVSHPAFTFDTEFGRNISNGELEFKDGFAVHVLKALQKLTEFKVKAHQTKDWGTVDKSGNCTGAIALIKNRKVDLMISSTAQNTERSGMVDFNFGTHTLEIGIFFRRVSGYTANDYFTLLAPFKPNFWAAILGWIFLNIFVYRIFRFALQQIVKIKPKEDNGCVFSCTEGTDDQSIASWGFTSIFQQGMPVTPPNTTLRILYYSQLLVAVVLNAAFSGTLISFLSVEKEVVTEIKEMFYNRYGFEFGMVNYPVTREYIQNATDQSVKDIYKQVQKFDEKYKDVDLNTHLNHIVDPKSGPFAYISDDLTTWRAIANDSNISSNDACKIKSLQIPESKQWQGTFVRKGSRLKRILDYSILRLMETGNIAILKSRYITKTSNCVLANASPETKLFELLLAFKILFGTSVLSIFLLIFEIIYFHSSDKLSKKLYNINYILD